MGDVQVIPYLAGEKEMLMASLDVQRDAVVAICRGCSDENLRKRFVVSESTILGIVKHLALVEGWWIHCVFGGLPIEVVSTEADPNADFRIEPR